MEDVSLNVTDEKIWILFNPFLDADIDPNCDYFDLIFYGVNARLQLIEPDAEKTDGQELEKLRILNGWPRWNLDINESNFINETFLNEIAISYKKGCFLGQETAAKIDNNRGAAFYPVLLEILSETKSQVNLIRDFIIEDRKAGTVLYQTQNYLQAKLFRDFRIIDRELILDFGEEKQLVKVLSLPLHKNVIRKDLALELYHIGVDYFQNNEIELAMVALKKALTFDPGLADAYESLGVMLGRLNKFDEAIEWMDKLLEVNPKSVLAHTNKSLFLMKLGRIEDAEAEKALATVKSFAVFGEEAKIKKQLEEEQKKKEEELLRREAMFLQVLEIDGEDTIALYGMADIFYQNKKYQEAALNLIKVIAVNSNYSTAYLLLGKCYEALDQTERAQAIYGAGIIVASKRGDMMPANEMQSRLNKLVVSASLS
jgi:folate-binding protein YgfZ